MHDDDGGSPAFDRALADAVRTSPWAGILEAMEASVQDALREHDAGTVLEARPGAASRPAALPGPTFSQPWTPPSNPGPMPTEFLDRALRLQELQRNATEQLELRLRRTAQHLAAIASVPESRPSGRSVFLDVTG